MNSSLMQGLIEHDSGCGKGTHGRTGGRDDCDVRMEESVAQWALARA